MTRRPSALRWRAMPLRSAPARRHGGFSAWLDAGGDQRVPGLSRLVKAWREEVAVLKRRAFAGEPVLGSAGPGRWGAERPQVLVLGLARRPTAPTGPGGCSVMPLGDQLFAALFRCGPGQPAPTVWPADGFAGQQDSDPALQSRAPAEQRTAASPGR